MPIRWFGPATYCTLAVAILLVVVVRILPIIGIGFSQTLSAIPVTLAMAPELLVWIGGSVVILFRWHKHPHVSRYALIAIGGLMLATVGPFLFQQWLISTGTLSQWSENTVRYFIFVQYVLTVALKVCCWVLLFVAMLGWREGLCVSGLPKLKM